MIGRPPCIRLALGGLALTFALGAPPVAAQDEMEEVTVTGSDDAAGLDPAGIDIVCRPPRTERDEWIDRFQRMVYERVCRSALWFDGFFGDARYDDLEVSMNGRLAVAADWDERDGLGSRFRFRGRYPLPQFNQRLSAFLGRTNEEEFVSNRNDNLLDLPNEFGATTDDEWLAGLGYSPLKDNRNKLRFDIGMRLSFPAEPFVRGAYRTHIFLGKRTLLRLRETGFWQREEGFGAASSADIERLLSEQDLLRLSASAAFAQFIDGVDWRSELTLFHNLSERRAIAYQLDVRGETDAPVSLQDFGARLIYRQRILRDWLYLDLRTSLTWPKELPQEPRTANPGVAVGFEMLFGSKPRERLGDYAR